jgi:DNA end-binding protein Ku
MALSLVEGMSEDWKPEQYHDTYKEDVLAMVKKKIKAGQTKTITAPESEPSAPKASNVVDLVALLQDSLGKRGGKAAPAKARATAADDEEEDETKPKSKATTTRSRASAPATKTSAKTAAHTAAAKRSKPAASRAKAA